MVQGEDRAVVGVHHARGNAFDTGAVGGEAAATGDHYEANIAVFGTPCGELFWGVGVAFMVVVEVHEELGVGDTSAAMGALARPMTAGKGGDGADGSAPGGGRHGGGTRMVGVV